MNMTVIQAPFMPYYEIQSVKTLIQSKLREEILFEFHLILLWGKINLHNLMPRLQAVVRVCDLAIAAILVLFTALACVSDWWSFY